MRVATMGRGIVFCAGVASLCALPFHCYAASERVIYSFQGGPNDGIAPYCELLSGSHGLILGTLASGGANNGGAVFTLTAKGKEALLTSLPHGAEPVAGLSEDGARDFIGTDNQGGTYGQGEIFKVSRAGKFVSLHSFTGAEHATGPVSRLVADQSGNFFGFAPKTAFKFSSSGKLTILHTFDQPHDGSRPVGDPILDKAGNLFGVTLTGGAHHYGTVFKIAPDGTETILYSFEGKADGANPISGLVEDADGNLFGTTIGEVKNVHGTVFKLSPTGILTVLHTFPLDMGESPDGFQPTGTLLPDGKGGFYGVTTYGGNSGAGTVYELSATGEETILHAFTGGGDGVEPNAGVILNKAGKLIGTTLTGGDHQLGTVYEVTP